MLADGKWERKREREDNQIYRRTEGGSSSKIEYRKKRNTKEIKKFFFSFDCGPPPPSLWMRAIVKRFCDYFLNITLWGWRTSHTSKWMCLDEWKETFFSGIGNSIGGKINLVLTSHLTERLAIFSQPIFPFFCRGEEENSINLIQPFSCAFLSSFFILFFCFCGCTMNW